MADTTVVTPQRPGIPPSVLNAHVTSGQTLANANVSALDKMIRNGQATIERGLDALNSEWKVREDRIVKPAGLSFSVDEKGRIIPSIGKAGEREAYSLTDHARSQVLSTVGLPPRYADHLNLLGLSDLLTESLNRLFASTASGGVMVRSVQRTVKAVLSPNYKRMDAAPIFDAFIRAALAAGLVPHRADLTDTRCLASFIRPEIVYISDTEALVYGVELRTSDYGNGALVLAVTITRLLCTNGLIGTNLFRRVHLGQRFESEGEVFQLSQETVALDIGALRSAVGDAMKVLPAHFTATTEVLRASVNKEVNLASALTALGKKGLSKATTEKVRILYETEQPVESLPAQPGLWRFSNVLSLLANSAGGDAAIELRDLAGEVMGTTAVTVA
jgi:hypothetical protein